MRISSPRYFSFQEILTEFDQYVVSEKKTCPIILVAQPTHHTPTLMSFNGALSLSLTRTEVTTLITLNFQ
jgi:hypothetical protein